MFYFTKTDLIFLIRENAEDFWRLTAENKNTAVRKYFRRKFYSRENLFEALGYGLLFGQFSNFPVSKTFEVMIVHHSHCLHERVTNGRTDEVEPAFLQITT